LSCEEIKDLYIRKLTDARVAISLSASCKCLVKFRREVSFSWNRFESSRSKADWPEQTGTKLAANIVIRMHLLQSSITL
jgi:hypothetical protein